MYSLVSWIAPGATIEKEAFEVAKSTNSGIGSRMDCSIRFQECVDRSGLRTLAFKVGFFPRVVKEHAHGELPRHVHYVRCATHRKDSRLRATLATPNARPVPRIDLTILPSPSVIVPVSYWLTDPTRHEP